MWGRKEKAVNKGCIIEPLITVSNRCSPVKSTLGPAWSMWVWGTLSQGGSWRIYTSLPGSHQLRDASGVLILRTFALPLLWAQWAPVARASPESGKAAVQASVHRNERRMRHWLTATRAWDLGGIQVHYVVHESGEKLLQKEFCGQESLGKGVLSNTLPCRVKCALIS